MLYNIYYTVAAVISGIIIYNNIISSFRLYYLYVLTFISVMPLEEYNIQNIIYIIIYILLILYDEAQYVTR